MFEELLAKLVEYKKLLPSLADQAKLEFSHFLSSLVKENRDAFLAFRMETDRLDECLWRYIGSTHRFSSLSKVLKMLLILSHGQAQVERGFTTNKQQLDDNMSCDTLVAQRIVHDHMLSHDIKPHQVEMTSRLMEFVKNARKNYFLEQKERGLKKLKTNAQVQREKLNEEIE